MPAGPAGIGIVLQRYQQLMDRMDAAGRGASPPYAAGPCGACCACCGPLSLLPLEAYALLAAGVLDDPPGASAACPLLDGGHCLAEGVRPFACRARGLPIRRLDAEGDWHTGSCGFIPRDGRGQAPVPIDEWAAHLYHLDLEFRRCVAVASGRIALAELCRAPDRYRTLLSLGPRRPLASRAAT